jgi:U2 small nuclear ribonucleoprotein A'
VQLTLENTIGLGIPAIENTGAMNDQFQCIDLTDNDITTLGGFSLLKRLRSLLLHSNPVTSISVNLSRTLPFLTSLLMSDNKLELFAEIDRLGGLRHLDTLVLSGNPITLKRNYRLYTIFKIPSLQVLDYQRVRLEERRAAKKLFESNAGQKFDDAVKSAAASTAKKDEEMALPTDTLDRITAINKAIAEATSEEELVKLEGMLSIGVIPTTEANGDGKKRMTDEGAVNRKRMKS